MTGRFGWRWNRWFTRTVRRSSTGLRLRLALDVMGGGVYVAGLDARAVLERPLARSHGDVEVYDVPGK